MGESKVSAVSIKGTSEGLIIELGPGDLESVMRELNRKLGQTANFFRGGRVALRVGPRILNRDEIEALGTLLYNWGVTLWAVESDAIETRAAADSLGLETGLGAARVEMSRRFAAGEKKEEGQTFASTAPASEGILVKRTLRSGTSLVHRGHVVVIGDVNPGAEIIAGGDIVVWGKLRGVVHAGAGGNEEAVVCALHLLPSQLRIGFKGVTELRDSIITRHLPQMASVRDDTIVIEPWTETMLSSAERRLSGWKRVLGRIEWFFGRKKESKR